MIIRALKRRLAADRPDARSRPRPERKTDLLRMIRNVAHLAGGNGTAALIGILTLALTARGLGPVALGIFAMIESYGKLCDQVIRLETWQATIRYGADILQRGDGPGFRRLVKLCIAIDLAGALLTGLVAFLAVPLIGAWLYWSPDVQLMAKVYSISLIFGIASAPLGILRLFDKFAQIAWLEPFLAVLRLMATFCIVLMGGGVWTFLLLSMVISAAQRVILMVMALHVLRKAGHFSFFTAPLRVPDGRFHGFWRFVLASNGTVLVRKATQEGDILVVGHVAGAHAAGVYQIVRKLTLSAVKLGGMFQQVVFPDLARLWARGKVDQFLTTLRQLELLTLLLGLAIVGTVAVAGRRGIYLVAGNGFEEAVTPLLFQSVAVLLFLSGSALRPAIMSMGYQVQQFWIVAASAAVFFVVLMLATPALGIVGAACAHIAFNLIWLPASLLLFASALRHEKTKAAPKQPAPVLP